MADAQVLDNVNVTENTANSATWVDGATIAAGSFTANKEYLIVAIISMKGTSTQLAGTRLVHGTTPTEFTDAVSATEMTATDVRLTQLYLYRFTQPGTTELVKLQFNNSDGTNVMTHQFSRIIAIKLSDDFVENTDFKWNEITTDGADAATYTNRATVTLTANGSDRWLLIGHAVSVVGAASVAHSLRIEDSVGPTYYGADSRLSKDTDDQFSVGYWVAFVPTNASHTFTLQTQSAASTSVISSRIFALNLSKFAQSAAAYTAGTSTPATSPSWTTVETLSPNPSATGNWVILANALVAPLTTDSVVSRLQINPDGGGLVSDPNYGDDAPDNVNNSNTNFGIFHLMSLRSLTSGAARAINFDWQKAGGSPTVKERALIAFSVALASTGYTLNIAAGSFALGGVAATTLKASLLNLAAGAYTKTGQAATLSKGYNLNVAAGSFVISGQDATFLRTYMANLAAGSYVDSGAAAGTLADRLLSEDPGVYSLAGQLAELLVARMTNASAGSYVLDGKIATLLQDKQLAALLGAYGLTGFAAEFTIGTPGAFSMNAEPGAYTIAGQNAALLIARTLAVNLGMYTLDGKIAQLIAERALNVEPGVYALVGQPNSLLTSRALNLANGVYGLTGYPVTLTSTGAGVILMRRTLQRRVGSRSPS